MYRSAKEVIQRVIQVAKALGVDPKMLLGCGDLPQELTEQEKRRWAQRIRESELRQLRRAMTPEQLEEHKAAERAKRSARSKAEYQRSQQQKAGGLPDAGSQPAAYNPLDELKDIIP